MERNKDLPREEQLKLVLKNYDKKQAECEALKKENAELKKRLEIKEKHFNEKLEQKDILYKNMLEHFQSAKADTKENWESKYKELKNMYAQRGDKMNKQKVELEKTRRMLDQARGVLCGAYNKIEDFCTEAGIGNKAVVKDGDITYETSSATKEINIVSPTPTTYQEYSLRQFQKYVREVMKNYKETGSLRGIATLAKDYGVRSMTKEQFFQFGLHNMANVTDEYLASIFPQTKKR